MIELLYILIVVVYVFVKTHRIVYHNGCNLLYVNYTSVFKNKIKRIYTYVIKTILGKKMIKFRLLGIY